MPTLLFRCEPQAVSSAAFEVNQPWPIAPGYFAHPALAAWVASWVTVGGVKSPFFYKAEPNFCIDTTRFYAPTQDGPVIATAAFIAAQVSFNYLYTGDAPIGYASDVGDAENPRVGIYMQLPIAVSGGTIGVTLVEIYAENNPSSDQFWTNIVGALETP